MNLIGGLAEHDVDVVLATLGAPLTVGQRREVHALANATVESSRYKLEGRPEAWRDVERASDWLARLATRHRVDAIHLNHLAHGRLPVRAPVLSVAHSCVLSWWDAVMHADAPSRFDRYREEVRRSLSASRAVITVSHDMARALHRHYGPLTDVTVVYTAARPRPVWPAHKEALVLSAGRMRDAARNVAAVVRVASQLPWPVVVAERAYTSDMVADADDDTAHVDAGAVQFTGRLNSRSMAALYNRAAVFVLPARYEPPGLTVLEAAQAGCALILGDIPSLRELWDGAALFVPPDDDAALMRAIRTVIADERCWRSLAFAARRRAASVSYDQFVRSYVIAYRTMQLASGIEDSEGGPEYPGLFDGLRAVCSERDWETARDC